MKEFYQSCRAWLRGGAVSLYDLLFFFVFVLYFNRLGPGWVLLTQILDDDKKKPKLKFSNPIPYYKKKFLTVFDEQNTLQRFF